MCWEALPVISDTLQWDVHIYWSAGMKETDVWSWWCMKSATVVRCVHVYMRSTAVSVWLMEEEKWHFALDMLHGHFFSIMILQVCIQSDRVREVWQDWNGPICGSKMTSCENIKPLFYCSSSFYFILVKSLIPVANKSGCRDIKKTTIPCGARYSLETHDIVLTLATGPIHY